MVRRGTPGACAHSSPPERQRARLLEAKTTFKTPSSRRGARWLVEQTEDPQRVFVEQLCGLCPKAERVQELAQEFRRIFDERRVELFDCWLDALLGKAG